MLVLIADARIPWCGRRKKSSRGGLAGGLDWSGATLGEVGWNRTT
nr:MAG TPA: hypothetical protein [Caudoviricetes sp.]